MSGRHMKTSEHATIPFVNPLHAEFCHILSGSREPLAKLGRAEDALKQRVAKRIWKRG
jgi:hypothetical protein